MTEENSELLKKIQDYVQDAIDISYLGLFGSSNNSDRLNDEYSDIDFVLVTDDINKYFEDEIWLSAFGDVLMTFTQSEPHYNYWERRCVFANGLDVDFILVDRTQLINNNDNFPVARNIFHKTLQSLIDKDGTGIYVEKLIVDRSSFTFPSHAEYTNLVNDFYYHYIWTYKKCLRGEYWTALQCINRYMKKRTLKMLEWYEHSIHGIDYYTFYDGRYLEKWVEKELLGDISQIFSSYGKESIIDSLSANNKLFSRIAKETANLNGFSFPKEREQRLQELIDSKYSARS